MKPGIAFLLLATCLHVPFELISVYTDISACNSDLSNIILRDFAPNTYKHHSTGLVTYCPEEMKPFGFQLWHFFISVPLILFQISLPNFTNISKGTSVIKFKKTTPTHLFLQRVQRITRSQFFKEDFLLSQNSSILLFLLWRVQQDKFWTGMLQWSPFYSWVFFCCGEIPTAIKTQVLEVLSLYWNREVHYLVFQLFLTMMQKQLSLPAWG